MPMFIRPSATCRNGAGATNSGTVMRPMTHISAVTVSLKARGRQESCRLRATSVGSVNSQDALRSRGYGRPLIETK